MNEEEMKKFRFNHGGMGTRFIVAVLILGICLVLCAYIGVHGLIEYKQGTAGGITVTGSASRNFTSDLIVWRGNFSQTSASTKEAYELLKKDSDMITKYLKENGVADKDIVFSSIDTMQKFQYIYGPNGNIQQEIPDGYTLSQSVTITSSEVDKIEGISRDITKLIDSGVVFISNQPEYFYTKLDELKLEMIAEATANARERADIIATNAKSRVGDLTTANLGVFQIIAQNSSSEEYSYGGTFNTWSKEKTASVTVKLFYESK